MFPYNQFLPMISALCLVTLSACTAPKKTSIVYDASKNYTSPVADLTASASGAEVVQRKGAFLSKRSILLENCGPLPILFEQAISFDSNGVAALSSISQKISNMSNIAIDLTPDIFNSQNSSQNTCPHAIATNPIKRKNQSPLQNQTKRTHFNSQCEPHIAINYQGTLRGLLTELASKAAIHWTYKDNKVVFSRLMQATFAVNAVSVRKNFSHLQPANNHYSSQQSSHDQLENINNTSQIERDNNFGETVAAASKLLSPHGKLIPSRISYSITVIDTASAVKNIRNFIENDNQTVLSQIGLSLRVYGVTLKNKNQPNIDWTLVMRDVDSNNNTSNSNQGKESRPITATSAAKIINDPAKLLAALQKQGQVKTILSTNINALNNIALPFSISDNRAYISGLTAVQDKNQPGNLYSLEQKTLSTGFSMKVLPTLLSHRKILMQIQLDLSNLEDMQTYKNVTGQIDTFDKPKTSKKDRASGILQLPRTSSISTLQQSVMKSGQTLLINGLHWSRIKPLEERRFFSRRIQSNTNNEQEIVILISPLILDDH